MYFLINITIHGCRRKICLQIHERNAIETTSVTATFQNQVFNESSLTLCYNINLIDEIQSQTSKEKLNEQ